MTSIEFNEIFDCEKKELLKAYFDNVAIRKSKPKQIYGLIHGIDSNKPLNFIETWSTSKNQVIRNKLKTLGNTYLVKII